MFFVYLLSENLGENKDSVSSLSLTAIAFMLINPFVLNQTGFVFSFYMFLMVNVVGDHADNRFGKRLNALFAAVLIFDFSLPVTALFYYEAHSETANILYELKYKNHPEIGEVMGRLMARELNTTGFFDGIDGIVPIPLAKKRQRQRGYNQSMEIARGVSEVTCLPIYNKVVRRNAFEGSQTNNGRWERNENVEHVFEVEDISAIQGKHLLIVDDVVTTGATVLACAQELCKAPNVKVTVLALGFAKS